MSDNYKGNHEDQGKDIDAFLEELEKINNEFNRISNDFEMSGKAAAGETETSGGEEASGQEPVEAVGAAAEKAADPADAASVANTGPLQEAAAPSGGGRSGRGGTGAAMTTSKKRSSKKKKKKYKIHWGRICLIVVCLGLMCCLGVGAWVWSVVRDAPEINTTNIYSMLPENSILYDDEGNAIETIYAADSDGLRTSVDYVDMPEDLIDAFVAIEDKTFWEHRGFNVIRIAGAIWDSISTGSRVGGTSTITQQLARNLYLEDRISERTLNRKVLEAYYAIQLERTLSKEQIIEAYLNVVFLGNNSSGVQAAAQGYFSKDVSELTLAECATLATLPQRPGVLAPLKTISNEQIEDPDALDIVIRGDQYTTYYDDAYKDRQALVLRFMEEQGYISAEEREAALAEDIRAAINPQELLASEISSYFADYVVAEVTEDLMAELDISEEDAQYMLNNGGLRIYSTLDTSMQKIAETEFANTENFPGVTDLNRNDNGDVRDSSGNILYYSLETYFNEDGSFTLSPEEYQMNEDGSMLVFSGGRLNFYQTESGGVSDVTLEFKPLYTVDENRIFYSMEGGYILIPSEYKTRDGDGNLLISAQFFEDRDWFTFDENGATVSAENFTIKERIMQPQAAMVVYDYTEGTIKAMTGGRSISGKLLFNRATSTRQPGSSIKPISVYAAALQSGADAVNSGVQDTTQLWTAASVIDDSPLVVGNRLWPKNWYSGYRGLHTMREAIQQSVNVCAVKCFNEIGADRCVALLKKLGITSIVESGDVNDLNPSALSLGGMTNGISPLEMAVAYGAFPSQGIYTEPSSYYRVTDKNGQVILENEAVKTQAMDAGVAYIMTDILRTTVSQGIASRANFSGQPVAGKTGTTSENYDVWFCGFTPYYSASLWIGNDVNIELTEGSTAAARLWSTIMRQIHAELPTGSYPGNPGNVVSATIDTKSGKLPSELSALDPRGTVRSEYFIRGTVPTETDDVHVAVTVCTDSGYLATPYCSHRESSVKVQRPEGSLISYGGFSVADIGYEAPTYYCNLHNLNPTLYPIDPNAALDSGFVWDGVTYGEDDWTGEDPDDSTEDGDSEGEGQEGGGEIIVPVVPGEGESIDPVLPD
ncbi:MAG: PBP1A family penicillin-binding protein, partial [Bacillota bacterium]|nr:PBP1A family penicillin-binding protein [Bacillota bacterium]